MSDKHLVEVRGLKKYFPIRERKNKFVKAVDGVDFYIDKGETFGLIGESGCGKSTVARCIMRLYDITGGKISFDGVDTATVSDRQFKSYRKRMQMIFQDPYSSLDPRMTVKQIIGEPMTVHKSICPDSELDDRIIYYLKLVGLNAQHMERYPHEFSGGQRQRIGIARSLIMEPDFIICDEPISALDVSIQAQVVNLFQDLQEKIGLTYLFIAHDLAMVKYVSDRIGVMYLGQIVETSTSKKIYNNPLHPYTKGLFASIPTMNPLKRAEKKECEMKGEIPSVYNIPNGCRFSTRCPYCTNECRKVVPELIEAEPDHFVACHMIKAK